MKLLRIDYGSGPALAVEKGGGIVPVSWIDQSAPSDMAVLIEQWDRWGKILSVATDVDALAIENVRLLPPIARPGKILCIGLNYVDHIEESGMERPREQMWFIKPATCITGPEDPIELPRVSEQLDYEAELVTIIGKTVRHADEAEARAAIFGYCAGNDVSVRDWQFMTSQFTLGKGFDSHAPIGPAIVTAEALDAENLTIQCRVNGEVRQSSNTKYLLFDPVDQIMHLSKVMTLEPGDLIFSGTPGGVGAGFKPPLWLADGDSVEVEIEGIGTLRNTVRKN
ncbi:fumarylacetoacetate hydrolase family protein [Novosphingobium aquimarinum]|uniref:fumarylacetoacetate hydrolase family protein n=1 Tax=Novosphingobium aquimarinum TaxID=2682494 RepID=UPI0012EC517E|nr:fumarylacetoacetate hydrolase family protein [Novosphingobium aquimarinum]